MPEKCYVAPKTSLGPESQTRQRAHFNTQAKAKSKVAQKVFVSNQRHSGRKADPDPPVPGRLWSEQFTDALSSAWLCIYLATAQEENVFSEPIEWLEQAAWLHWLSDTNSATLAESV